MLVVVFIPVFILYFYLISQTDFFSLFALGEGESGKCLKVLVVGAFNEEKVIVEGVISE